MNAGACGLSHSELSAHLSCSCRGQNLQTKPEHRQILGFNIKAGDLQRLAEKVGALEIEASAVDRPVAVDGDYCAKV